MPRGENINNLKLTLIVTHNCNLSCVYCYQHKKEKSKRMSDEIAKASIEEALNNSPYDFVDISFIGGEPLLEFDLIRNVCEWVWNRTDWKRKYSFYATTNGILLTKEMKRWFIKNKERFSLGLSLDGRKETHDMNRCGSFDKIEFDFFLSNWPEKPVKMTISDLNLRHLADDVIYIHERGFKLSGCNFAEGCSIDNFEQNRIIIAEQYKKLVDYYVQHPEISHPRLFDISLDLCEDRNNGTLKKCGTGDNMIVVDCDGKKYPCIYFSPVTMNEYQLSWLTKQDLKDAELFIDKKCLENCYFYPVCEGCYGDNFTSTGTLCSRSKQKCILNKLRIVAAANYQGQMLVMKLKHAHQLTPKEESTIKAILKINANNNK